MSEIFYFSIFRIFVLVGLIFTSFVFVLLMVVAILLNLILLVEGKEPKDLHHYHDHVEGSNWYLEDDEDSEVYDDIADFKESLLLQFKDFDINGDEFLDAAEMRHILPELRKKPVNLFQLFWDVDKKQRGKLSLEEYIEYREESHKREQNMEQESTDQEPKH